ncbi:hypothetical protein PP707_04700 [Acetobacter pasteurianus]|nr:hypothetical protein [Acetobacter pasteurianus]
MPLLLNAVVINTIVGADITDDGMRCLMYVHYTCLDPFSSPSLTPQHHHTTSSLHNTTSPIYV